ncbi:unnamed protein product [Allacma fusca]|uniref:PID domain-containing protein n=1 Tax=Allacma fusca TaxID=39272 RepID=A0A8J2LJD7_9HEXA|nr:unnamed protein product [Allacma fusca]
MTVWFGIERFTIKGKKVSEVESLDVIIALQDTMQRMDRLRRSLRDSFRRKREAPESSKPHQWQADEEAVRSGTCSFHVKYLGCVEVFESRGMQVCEEAMKVLRQSRRRPVKSILFVSGDGLRVVEDDTKGLIVDQTIEKVSFCAPDRNHERGFSYICRDGTTRRWMCHGFLASKESVNDGERLSHAVGCAFASCLERKQKREKECGVSMSFDPKTSTFTRSGSFRVGLATESMKSTSPPPGESGNGSRSSSVVNTHAIERPHAPAKMLERQGSFRGFSQLANQSPFKRQLSLRLSDLPSNLQRTQNNVDILTNNNVVIATDPIIPQAVNASPTPPPRTQRNRLHSLPNNSLAGHGVIPQSSAISMTGIINAAVPKPAESKDLVSELCQQVTQGLSMLAANHDDLKNGSTNTSQFPTKFTNPWDEEVGDETKSTIPMFTNRPISNPSSSSSSLGSSNAISSKADNWTSNLSHNLAQNQITKPIVEKNTSASAKVFSGISSATTVSPLTSSVTSTSNSTGTGSRPSAILPAAISSANSTGADADISSTWVATSPSTSSGMPGGIPRRAPPSRSHSLGADPFDADWASSVARTGQAPTNPFVRQQTFQVSIWHVTTSIGNRNLKTIKSATRDWITFILFTSNMIHNDQKTSWSSGWNKQEHRKTMELIANNNKYPYNEHIKIEHVADADSNHVQ